jgi:hypothetical protein
LNRYQEEEEEEEEEEDRDCHHLGADLALRFAVAAAHPVALLVDVAAVLRWVRLTEPTQGQHLVSGAGVNKMRCVCVRARVEGYYCGRIRSNALKNTGRARARQQR